MMNKKTHRKKNGEYIFDLNSSRIIASYDKAREAYDGKLPFPRMAIIYSTYGCNHRCAGCEYEKVNKEQTTHMALTAMLKLLDELKSVGTKSVEFSGGGEPTLYPHLPRAISECRSRDMSVGLLTNGVKINVALAEAVVREVSYIRISLDAATEKTYRNIRRAGKNDFSRVLNNLKTLVSKRNASGSSLLIGIKFLISTNNCGEISEARDLALELGVDSLQFKPQRHSPFEIPPDRVKFVSEQIESLKEKPGLRIIGGVQKEAIRGKCRLTPLQTTISPNGDVFLCNYFLHRKSNHCIGNILENSFEEIWKSDRHKKAVAGITPRECNIYDCRFIRYSKIIEPIIMDPGRQLDFF